MAQLDKELYVTLAKQLVNCKDSVYGASSYLEGALDAIVDITTDNYPAEVSVEDAAAAAREVTLSLLSPLNAAYQSMKQVSDSYSPVTRAAAAINNFVISKSDVESNFPADKLQSYIDSIDSELWDDAEPSSGQETPGSGQETLESWIEICREAGLEDIEVPE